MATLFDAIIISEYLNSPDSIKNLELSSLKFKNLHKIAKINPDKNEELPHLFKQHKKESNYSDTFKCYTKKEDNKDTRIYKGCYGLVDVSCKYANTKIKTIIFEGDRVIINSLDSAAQKCELIFKTPIHYIRPEAKNFKLKF